MTVRHDGTTCRYSERVRNPGRTDADKAPAPKFGPGLVRDQGTAPTGYRQPQASEAGETCRRQSLVSGGTEKKAGRPVSNVRTEVAERGFEIYVATTPRPTRDQLNTLLAVEGLEPISDRMYRHYRVMDRRGQTVYLTINEWDIRRKVGANLN